MRILAVDDEKLMLAALKDSIAEAEPDAEIYAFRKAQEALNFARENEIDVAFLDIRMRGMDGLELGREVLNLYPELNLIFCTGYDEYISEAFREIRCNGYITKPVDAVQIATELAHLRVPMARGKNDEEKTVSIRCFGYFEAFVKGKPLEFGSGKTKELFAYLVHSCGRVCSNQEIMTCMWEDDKDHYSYFKKMRKDLEDTLQKNHCEDILFRQWGGLGIDTEKVTCDLYSWKKKHNGPYKGNYMLQYSWANGCSWRI